MLKLDKHTIRLGDTLTIGWQLGGNTMSVRNLQVWLEGKEQARYRRGTDTYTDEHTFATIPIVETNQGFDMIRGSRQIQIPADSMHSLDAPNNKILWQLRVTGEIRWWPDIGETFPIVVEPHAEGDTNRSEKLS